MQQQSVRPHHEYEVDTFVEDVRSASRGRRAPASISRVGDGLCFSPRFDGGLQIPPSGWRP